MSEQVPTRFPRTAYITHSEIKASWAWELLLREYQLHQAPPVGPLLPQDLRIAFYDLIILAPPQNLCVNSP